jgi:hypothetical protein
LHEEFIHYPEGGLDDDYDNYDRVLDAMQNFFVKWIIEKTEEEKTEGTIEKDGH